MKQNVRYQNLVIAGKLRTEVKITVDDARPPEYSSDFNGDKHTSISLFPIISISLTKAMETDDDGNRKRAPWNPNDTLGMTKYQLPQLVNELEAIQKDLKIIELYHYPGGKRLEINEEIAEKIRRVFAIGNVTVELSAVVINNLNDERLEGIKMKFNNEQSSVLLTLLELDSLVFTLKNLDIDSIALLLYLNYITKPNKPRNFDTSTFSPNIDIPPKTDIIPEPIG